MTLALCECGCGAPAPIAAKTSPSQGHVKGEPMRFIHGHGSRGRTFPNRGKFPAKPNLRTCPQCSTVFDAPAINPFRKFCSPACQFAAKQRQVDRLCEGCGTTFQTRASYVERGGGRWCSRSCWAKHAPSPALRPEVADKISVAKTTHGKRTGKRQRQLEHAGMTLAAKGESCCRNCGRSGLLLQLHHAIPRSMWKAGILEPLNGIPLCVRCHMGWHHRYVTIYRDVFRAEEWACLEAADLLGQKIGPWLDERYPSREP